MVTETTKPRLLIMASWGARSGPSSPLLRFVRDYVATLRRFEVFATGGTGRSILGTGLYDERDVRCVHSGPDGGVVQLAAMVARQECAGVVFLSDPNDLRSDVPENYALRRVCKELGIRLMTTLASAEEWASLEAESVLSEWALQHDVSKSSAGMWQPSNWEPGTSNEGGETNLPDAQQTLALIAHDGKKEEMVVFANDHSDFLGKFHRILTTGTTGYLIKMLHAENDI